MKQNRQNLARVRGRAGAALLILVATACGGGDQSDSVITEEPTVTSSESTQTLIVEGIPARFESGSGSVLEIGPYGISLNEAEIDMRVDGAPPVSRILKVGDAPFEIDGWTIELIDAPGPGGHFVITDPDGVAHP